MMPCDLDFIHAITCVDRLNSWVRSDSYRANVSSSPKRATYWLKRKAIASLQSMNLCFNRHVAAIVKCNRCDGKGNYYGWWYDPRSPGNDTPDDCRNCHGGKVDLHFIETVSDELGIRWHTPKLEWISHFRWDESLSSAVEAGNWQPNSPGRDATPAEVASWFNAAEEYWPGYPGPYYGCHGRCDDYKYSLHVGDTDPKTCSLCGAPAAEGGYAVTRDRLAWRDHACRECDARFDRTTKWNGTEYASNSIFDAFPLPTHLISDPAIQRWIERHPVPSQQETAHA